MKYDKMCWSYAKTEVWHDNNEHVQCRRFSSTKHYRLKTRWDERTQHYKKWVVMHMEVLRRNNFIQIVITQKINTVQTIKFTVEMTAMTMRMMRYTTHVQEYGETRALTIKITNLAPCRHLHIFTGVIKCLHSRTCSRITGQIIKNAQWQSTMSLPLATRQKYKST